MRYLLILLLTTVTFAAKPFTVESFLSELSAKGPTKHERLIKKNQEKLQQLSDSDTYTLINALADSGWGQTISYCKTYLIPIDAFSAEHKTALQKAFLSGEYDKAKLLLQSGCDPTIRLKKYNDGDGLLYHAIQEQKFALFKALIDAGVNPNTAAGEGVDLYKKPQHWLDKKSPLWYKNAKFLQYILENSTHITKLPSPLIEYLIHCYSGNAENKQLFHLVKHGIIKEEALLFKLHLKYLLSILPTKNSRQFTVLFAYPSVLHATDSGVTPLLTHILHKKGIFISPEKLIPYLDSINCSYETFKKDQKSYVQEILFYRHMPRKNRAILLQRVDPKKLTSLYGYVLQKASNYGKNSKEYQLSYTLYSEALEIILETGATPIFEHIPNEEGPLISFLSQTIHTQHRAPKSYAKFLEVLLKCDVDINKSDKYGRTPLSWTQLLPKGNPLEKMLLDAGAKELDEEYWGE